ncbi:MAG: benzoate/H(+) symporter BenE family transporter [Hyphomicrobiales bacterium]
MLRDFSLQAGFAGLLAAFVGFASSFAIVLQGLTATGANNAEAASGLMISAIAMGLGCIIFAILTRNPVSCAWTTPGAAFLVTTGGVEGGFPVAVGAFLICAVALTLSGFIKPLSNLVSKLPASLASAMLGGILLGLCFQPFKAIAVDPALGLPIFLAWVIVGVFSRPLAVPAALLAFVIVVFFAVDLPQDTWKTLSTAAKPELVLVKPEFTFAGLIGLALPLYIITMAAQNIPGIAAMKTFGYPLRPRLWFSTTGALSLLAAPFGGVAVNLAAITAAIVSSEEAHPDKDKRYWASITNGLGYIFFGLTAAGITAFVSLAPTILIQAVAGLALIGAFTNATLSAFKEPTEREAAAVTFLMTASGMSLFGISGAFWGLLAGGLVMVLKKLRPAAA